MESKVPATKLMRELLELYSGLLIPFMKVRRDMPFPTEPHRQETDGEHAFTLAVLSISLVERTGKNLDTGLIAKYALVHDLVEAYAGDISVRAHEKDHLSKKAAEAKALRMINRHFAKTAPWIGNLIEKYEAQKDEEARFVYAVDKLMGALARLADNGESWAEYYPEVDGSGYHRAVERLRQKATAYPDLLELFDTLHNHLDKQWPKYLGLKEKRNE